jgi:hypothetical protein
MEMYLALQVHFPQSQWVKYKWRLKVDAVPLQLCTCNVPIKRLEKRPEDRPQHPKTAIEHDHPYAFSISPLCPIHNKLQATAVMKENCSLQNELHILQQKLSSSQKKDVQARTVLSSIENKQPESSPQRKPYDIAEIQRGITLRFAMGSTAYEKVIEVFPDKRLPAIRSLNRRTEHIKSSCVQDFMMRC